MALRSPPELVRTVLRDNEPDWVNTIFLSTRFTAWRVGGYNEFLYTFFKCLTDERIAYADGWFAEAHDDTASVTMDGWEIQRRCPHLKADLSKFGVVEGRHPDLQSARLAVEPGDRPLPDRPGSRAAQRTRGAKITQRTQGAEITQRTQGAKIAQRTRGAKITQRAPMTGPRHYDDGLIQLDREAITLRRYHFPSGTSQDHPAAVDPRLQGRPLGLLISIPDLGQYRSAPLVAPGCVAADEVHTGDAGRAGCVAKPAFTPQRPEGVSGDAGRAAGCLALRFQYVCADERHQDLGNAHAAVGLLMVFQDRDQPARSGQRPVQCCCGLWLTGSSR